jgi:CubicO group peptidase (beta-lactamase class C family)
VAVKLTPGDMIKLGNLLLNKGIWNGQRVVSEAWAGESTKNHISTGISIPYERGYGYLWWVYEGGEHLCYFANGYGGQFIVVVPELEIVVVATNNWVVPGNKADENWYRTITLIMENVIPAVQ